MSASIKLMDYDEWYEFFEEDLHVYFAESGADREMDFDLEKALEKEYERYSSVFGNPNPDLSDFNAMVVANKKPPIQLAIQPEAITAWVAYKFNKDQTVEQQFAALIKETKWKVNPQQIRAELQALYEQSLQDL